jgi:C-terminal processing protease CtpA/Prc
MKKTKVVLILFLGLLLGRVSAQFTHIYATAHEPKLAAKNMTLSGIIQSIGQVVAPRSSVTARYRRFDEIYQLLQDKYYDTTKLNSGVMLERAVKAFVDGIDDPYTVYMDSAQNSGFHEELK